MIVDIHTHTFPDKIAGRTIEKLQGVSHSAAFSDGTAAGLRASMARAGVDRSVVLPVATHPGQVERVNDASARMNETTEETGILSLGCIHPDFANWREELERVAALGLRGVKLHPVYQGVDLDDVRYLRILERCGELGLVVITHAGWDIGFPGQVNCSPRMVLRAVKQVGPVKLVLAHMGGWRCWDEVEELLWDTGVCLDTAFSLPPAAVGAVTAALALVIILGGIRGIARVSSVLVPAMAVLYLGAGLAVILGNWRNLPQAVGDLFLCALSPRAAAGGARPRTTRRIGKTPCRPRRTPRRRSGRCTSPPRTARTNRRAAPSPRCQKKA